MIELEAEADAWEVEAPQSMQDSRGLNTAIVRHFTYVPAHERDDKEPLYSSETIQEEISDLIGHLTAKKEISSRDLDDDTLDYSIEQLEKLEEVFSSD